MIDLKPYFCLPCINVQVGENEGDTVTVAEKKVSFQEAGAAGQSSGEVSGKVVAGPKTSERFASFSASIAQKTKSVGAFSNSSSKTPEDGIDFQKTQEEKEAEAAEEKASAAKEAKAAEKEKLLAELQRVQVETRAAKQLLEEAHLKKLQAEEARIAAEAHESKVAARAVRERQTLARAATVAVHEKEVLCATKIQSSFRSTKFKTRLRKQVLNSFEKLYDPEDETYYYRSMVTGDIQWNKPMFLRPNDDIPITNRAKKLQKLASDTATASIVPHKHALLKKRLLQAWNEELKEENEDMLIRKEKRIREREVREMAVKQRREAERKVAATLHDSFEAEADLLLQKHVDERDRKQEEKRRELNQMEQFLYTILFRLADECVVFVDMERRSRASKKLAQTCFMRKFKQDCFQNSRHAVWSEMQRLVELRRERGHLKNDKLPRPCFAELLKRCQVWPMSTTRDVEHGMLPIHYALQNLTVFGDDVLRMLLRINPEAVLQETSNGMLPLALAIRSCASLPIIQTLLELHPAASSHATRDGSTALHYVCNGLDEETTAVLCEASKRITDEACSLPCLLSPTISHLNSKVGSLPIHLALQSKKSSLGSILVMMKAEPAALEIPDGKGNLPLHLIMKGSVWSLLEPALTLYPEGGLAINAANQTPLSALLRCIFDITVNHDNKCEFLKRVHDANAAVEILVQRCPECVKIRNDKSGEYPLHLALRCSASPKVVQIIMDAHAYVARNCVTNYRGNTPLHLACQTNGKARVVEQLLKFEESKVAAFHRNKRGELPLHVAAQEKSCSSKVVGVVLGLHPEATIEEISKVDFIELTPEEREDPSSLLLMDRRPSKNVAIPATKQLKKAIKNTNNVATEGIFPPLTKSSSTSQRNKCTPLSLAITHGASKNSVKAIAEATKGRIHKEDPSLDYGREYFEMNYTRFYSGHSAAKRAFGVAEVPTIAIPTPLQIQRQTGKRPTKHWSYKRIVEQMFLNENDAPTQQWGFHALQQKLSLDAADALARVQAKMEIPSFKAHPFGLKATDDKHDKVRWELLEVGLVQWVQHITSRFPDRPLLLKLAAGCERLLLRNPFERLRYKNWLEKIGDDSEDELLLTN